MEVALAPEYKSAHIHSFDIDNRVVQQLQRTAATGEIDVAALSAICRSAESTNCYLTEREPLRERLAVLSALGVHLRVEERNDGPRVSVDQTTLRSIEAATIDLRVEAPAILGAADVIFEGFMLVNWVKEEGGWARVRHLLRDLERCLGEDAWFASATSMSLLQASPGADGLLAEAMAVGLTPLAGALLRWRTEPGRGVTSQFVTVLAGSSATPNASEGRLASALGTASERMSRRCFRSMALVSFPAWQLAEKLQGEGGLISFWRESVTSYCGIEIDWSSVVDAGSEIGGELDCANLLWQGGLDPLSCDG